jgi:hypothetical protein
LVAAIPSESIILVSRLTTLEALSRVCVSDSREDVEAICRRAECLADSLRRHYFRSVKRWALPRQAEVARLIIESKSAVAEAEKALMLDDMPGAVAWLSGAAELFDRTYQLAMFGNGHEA